jgi:hypothetical protein
MFPLQAMELIYALVTSIIIVHSILESAHYIYILHRCPYYCTGIYGSRRVERSSSREGFAFVGQLENCK